MRRASRTGRSGSRQGHLFCRFRRSPRKPVPQNRRKPAGSVRPPLRQGWPDPGKPRSCWAERDSIARWAMREAAPETRTSLDRARSLIERGRRSESLPKIPLLLWRPTTSPRTAVRPAMTPRSVKRSASSAVKASGPSVAIPRCRPEPRYSARSPAIRNFASCRGSGTEVAYSN
jgi:hypothetical protein